MSRWKGQEVWSDSLADRQLVSRFCEQCLISGAYRQLIVSSRLTVFGVVRAFITRGRSPSISHFVSMSCKLKSRFLIRTFLIHHSLFVAALCFLLSDSTRKINAAHICTRTNFIIHSNLSSSYIKFLVVSFPSSSGYYTIVFKNMFARLMKVIHAHSAR